jgi:hypothetical protein
MTSNFMKESRRIQLENQGPVTQDVIDELNNSRKCFSEVPLNEISVKSEELNKLPLVKFDFSKIPTDFHKKYPFRENDKFVVLGELKQMPGHCVVVNHKTGEIHSGYHTDNFVLIED